jgi:hypothetical protein
LHPGVDYEFNIVQDLHPGPGFGNNLSEQLDYLVEMAILTDIPISIQQSSARPNLDDCAMESNNHEEISPWVPTNCFSYLRNASMIRDLIHDRSIFALV